MTLSSLLVWIPNPWSIVIKDNLARIVVSITVVERKQGNDKIKIPRFRFLLLLLLLSPLDNKAISFRFFPFLCLDAHGLQCIIFASVLTMNSNGSFCRSVPEIMSA